MQAWRQFSIRPRMLAAMLCANVLAAAGDAASPAWPVRGEVQGRVKVAALDELDLPWRVEARAGGLTLSAKRAGLDLELALRPGEGGAWRWEVRRGEADVAEIWPLLRARLGKEAAGWSASGRITLGGEGTWKPEEGPQGELRLALREGWARSEELDAELSGVELEVATRDLAAGGLAEGQSLRVARIRAGNLVVNEMVAEFGIAAAGAVEVSRLRAKMLGGSVVLDPVTVSLREPEIETVLTMTDFSVSEIAKLTPEAVAGGGGALSGRAIVSWSANEGFKIVEGGLMITRGDHVTLRLAPLPGFLTDKLPPVLAWISPRLAKDLRSIELGKTLLAVENMRVIFNPDGVDGGRTAQIVVNGRPAAGGSVRSVNLEVNIAGDLTRVLMLGLSDQVTLRF